MRERLTFDTSPPMTDGEFLEKRLDEYNVTATGRDDFRPILMVCRDDAEEIVAGIKGQTRWDWLYVQILWVAQKMRKSGIGSKLLEMAEQEARQRGCKHATLSTFSFQARPFYQKRGYEVFAELSEYPGKETKHFLKKTL